MSGRADVMSERDVRTRRDTIAAIAVRVREAGGRAMLVGGCVRDGLLGRESGDIDCEVYGVEPDALRTLASAFGAVDESGARYGVYSLRALGIDLAIPRTERRTGPLHGDFDVTPNPWLTPEQAGMRRDFTVNAILRDALTGEYVDPFGGREDLARGVLRAMPGGQFEEDPLRVLRGAQFAARFGLEIDGVTLASMMSMPLGGLSPARVTAEMKKALLESDRPDVFFRVLAQVKGLTPWFSEIAALCGVMQNPRYHPEGDAFEHTMLVLAEAAAMRGQAVKPLPFMLAALTHDLGKAVSTAKNGQGEWQSVGHENTGVPLVQAMLVRLCVPQSAIRYAQDMCRLHMRVHGCYYTQARLSRTQLLFDASICPRDLALLAVCDARGTGKPRGQAQEEERFIKSRLTAYECAAEGQMPTGNMLMAAGVRPGADLGEALRQARRQVLCGVPLERAVMQSACALRERDAERNIGKKSTEAGGEMMEK